MRTILKGGHVVTGTTTITADVVVEGSRIAFVGNYTAPLVSSDKVVDCSDLVVAPGFIDAHSHDDVAATMPDLYEAKIRQGITTVAIGMDGLGYAPVAPNIIAEMVRYWRPVNGDPKDLWGRSWHDVALRYTKSLGLNVIPHVPHGTVRAFLHGFRSGALDYQELRRLEGLVMRELSSGGLGLSTGLGYVPGMFADYQELLFASRPLSLYGLPYVSHLRSYGIGVHSAIGEAMALGRDLDIPVHISHLHLSHPNLFGQASSVLERLRTAAQQGLSLTWDLYPYSAGSSILHSYLPAWLVEGGPDQLSWRMRNASIVAQLGRDPDFVSVDWDKVVIAGTETGNHVGWSVAQAADQMGHGVAEFVCDLLVSERLNVSCIVHQTDPADDDVFATASQAVVGSDGLPFGQRPHPRFYGAFPAFYHRYVRELKAMSMADALYKMGPGVAKIYHLGQRGLIAEQAYADLVVFDPKTYAALATYEHPREFAQGVRHVLINGVLVLEAEQFMPEKKAGTVVART